MSRLVRYEVEILVDDDTEVDLSHRQEISDWLLGYHDDPISIYEKVKKADVRCMSIKNEVD